MLANDLLEGPAAARGVSLPKLLMDAAVDRAWEERRAFSHLVRDAIVLYLEREEKKGEVETGERT